MKFEVGKFYKTCDGRKARCVCNDKDGYRPNIFVLGEAYYSTDEEGFQDNANHRTALDIVGPWIDKPQFDFSEWPKWVKYAVMDKDGLWCASKNKPEKHPVGWRQQDDHCILIPKEHAPKWDGPWEESLCVREDA